MEKYIGERVAPLWCSDFCVDNDEAWLVHGSMNLIVCYSFNEKRVKTVIKVPDEKAFQDFLFIRIIKIFDKLVLVPLFADSIYVFDSANGEMLLKKNVRNVYKYGGIFADACIVQDKVYCIPQKMGDPIAVVDVNNGNSVSFIEKVKSDKDGKYVNHCCFDGRRIIYAIPEEKDILEYDIETGEFNSVCIDGLNGIDGVQIRDGFLYVSSVKDMKIVKVSKKENEVVSEFYPKVISGAFSLMDDDRIWVDCREPYANIITENNKDIIEIDKRKFGEAVMNPLFGSGPSYMSGNDFYYYNRYRSAFFRHHKGEWCEYDVRVKYEGVVCESDIANTTFQENSMFQLEDVLSILSSGSTKSGE